MIDTLPASLAEAVSEFFEKAGDTTAIHSVQLVSGGDISHAARVATKENVYFLKWNTQPLPAMFEVEALGLQKLAETGLVRVPAVIGHHEAGPGRPAFICLEWIEQDRADTEKAGTTLGKQLAQMHAAPASHFGLEYDNYIGALCQPNQLVDSWVDFYAEFRLGVQIRLAADQGLLPSDRARRLGWLQNHLDYWIADDAIRPSLIHGDLWGGNFLVDDRGEPVLIDPAVHYADHEVELAFTELFGGFPPSFYAAYDEVYPRSDAYRERRPLYQLYHLLTHLNLFGEGYGRSIDQILQQYTPSE